MIWINAFLLHFCFLQADLHRSAYWPKLTDFLGAQGLGEYKKNREDMYHILYPYMENAITNAKKLDIINEGKQPSAATPGTKVYVLVEKLRPYLTETM